MAFPHMWTQIVGKIRLALTPLVNHLRNVPLYVAPRGLSTSAIPYNDRFFQITFDFISHLLLIETTDGSTKTIALRSRSVAEFYQEMMAALKSLGMPVTIWTTPVEVADRFYLKRIRSIRPMIQNMRSGSGAFWHRLAEC